MITYAVFLTGHNINGEVKRDLAFYHANTLPKDLYTDWRFKGVPGKRLPAIYLGMVNAEFPITKWPLISSSKISINPL